MGEYYVYLLDELGKTNLEENKISFIAVQQRKQSCFFIILIQNSSCSAKNYVLTPKCILEIGKIIDLTYEYVEYPFYFPDF